MALPSWVMLAHLSLVAAHTLLPPELFAGTLLCAPQHGVMPRQLEQLWDWLPALRSHRSSRTRLSPSSSLPPTAVLSKVHFNQKGAFIIRSWGQASLKPEGELRMGKAVGSPGCRREPRLCQAAWSRPCSATPLCASLPSLRFAPSPPPEWEGPSGSCCAHTWPAELTTASHFTLPGFLGTDSAGEERSCWPALELASTSGPVSSGGCQVHILAAATRPCGPVGPGDSFYK